MLPNTGEQALRLLPAIGFIIVLAIIAVVAYRAYKKTQ